MGSFGVNGAHGAINGVHGVLNGVYGVISGVHEVNGVNGFLWGHVVHGVINGIHEVNGAMGCSVGSMRSVGPWCAQWDP